MQSNIYDKNRISILNTPKLDFKEASINSTENLCQKKKNTYFETDLTSSIELNSELSDLNNKNNNLLLIMLTSNNEKSLLDNKPKSKPLTKQKVQSNKERKNLKHLGNFYKIF